MSSSKSLPKHASKSSFKIVSAFDMFYQLTYMSAMAAAGISRSKIFEIAAQSKSNAAAYFEAVNTLVDEFRYDYAEACRSIGLQSKSENMKTFLLRLSDALRSGEPLAEYLAREAGVTSEDYENGYERDLEGLKQWTNAFSSLVMSVSLIIIIQIVSAMIYSLNPTMMMGLVVTGVFVAAFGAWIIMRSAPKENMIVPAAQGSPQQQQALRLSRILIPTSVVLGVILSIIGLPISWSMMIAAAILAPVGYISMQSDKEVVKKDIEFSTFLRSLGGMATSSGTTLKQALTKIDLSSFPTLEPDIDRLSTRLSALVEPTTCWHKFGLETGSRLISEVSDIFYGAVKIGGDPERVGFLCSLFTAKTTQLRSKRRLTAGTFSGLATVMQAVVTGLMIFVLSIVTNFASMVAQLMPKSSDSMSAASAASLTIGQFSAGDLQFLGALTLVMVLILGVVSAAAMIFCDGGYKLKITLYLAMIVFISGICFLLVPPMVAGILSGAA